jgi:hypothetical protein
MMPRGLIFLVLFSLQISAFAQAEHDILMMSGQTVKGTVTGEDSVFIYYDYYKKDGSTKARKLDVERVFSIKESSGDERVIYMMDTAIGNYYSVQEMRYYIKGEQDAMDHYRGNWAWAIGVPATAALGFVFSGSVISFAVPFVYLVVAGIPPSKIPKNKIDDPALAQQEAYILGFERTARNKRLFKALTGGLIGTVGGFAGGQIVRAEP